MDAVTAIAHAWLLAVEQALSVHDRLAQAATLTSSSMTSGSHFTSGAAWVESRGFGFAGFTALRLGAVIRFRIYVGLGV